VPRHQTSASWQLSLHSGTSVIGHSPAKARPLADDGEGLGPFPTALSPAAIWLARAGQRRGRRAVPPELPITMKSQG